MKIGIEAQRMMRKKKHGMDMVAINLLERLPKVAPQHEYILFTAPGDDDELIKRLKGIKIVYVNGLSYIDWEQLWLPLAIAKEGVDVMHFTGNTASLFCPVPYVLTLHDVIYLESSFSKSKSLYQQIGFYYRKLIVPWVARKAAKVITVSKYECRKIKQVIRNLNNVDYIYNAIGEDFAQSEDSLKIKEKLPEHFMFFLGNTDPKKNTLNVIRAYIHYRKNFEGVMSLVIGDFPSELLKKILVENNAIDLLPTITTLGYIANNELPTIYRHATCFLYPSLRESFGIPILEAMACECPVITSNTSCMPEIAGEAAVQVNPCDHIDIALAMLTIGLTPAKLKRHALLGKDQIKQFSWRSSAFQYASVFEELNIANHYTKPFTIKA